MMVVCILVLPVSCAYNASRKRHALGLTTCENNFESSSRLLQNQLAESCPSTRSFEDGLDFHDLIVSEFYYGTFDSKTRSTCFT